MSQTNKRKADSESVSSSRDKRLKKESEPEEEKPPVVEWELLPPIAEVVTELKRYNQLSPVAQVIADYARSIFGLYSSPRENGRYFFAVDLDAKTFHVGKDADSRDTCVLADKPGVAVEWFPYFAIGATDRNRHGAVSHFVPSGKLMFANLRSPAAVAVESSVVSDAYQLSFDFLQQNYATFGKTSVLLATDPCLPREQCLVLSNGAGFGAHAHVLKQVTSCLLSSPKSDADKLFMVMISGDRNEQYLSQNRVSFKSNGILELELLAKPHKIESPGKRVFLLQWGFPCLVTMQSETRGLARKLLFDESEILQGFDSEPIAVSLNGAATDLGKCPWLLPVSELDARSCIARDTKRLYRIVTDQDGITVHPVWSPWADRMLGTKLQSSTNLLGAKLQN